MAAAVAAGVEVPEMDHDGVEDLGVVPPSAAHVKMKPYVDAILTEYEALETKHNQKYVSAMNSAIEACSSYPEFKALYELLPSSGTGHGRARSMNRILESLKGHELLPADTVFAWGATGKKGDTQRLVVFQKIESLFDSTITTAAKRREVLSKFAVDLVGKPSPAKETPSEVSYPHLKFSYRDTVIPFLNRGTNPVTSKLTVLHVAPSSGPMCLSRLST
jgi:hypothetical protein